MIPARAGLTFLILALLAIYFFTMPPTLTWAHWGSDGGDLAVAIAKSRLPHPPGFPSYLLLGEVFTRIPWGETAWKLNLMSAAMAAGTAGLCAWAVWKGTGSLQSSIIASLSLGLSPLFWSQAIITEVYAPAAFFSAALLFLSLLKAPAWLSGAVWGVGVGVHPALVFLAPLVLWSAGRKGQFLQAICAFLLVIAALYGPFLLSRRAVPNPWANLSTLSGWWDYVSARFYRGYFFSLPSAFWPERLLAWLALMARQFTPIGAPLVAWGFYRLWQDSRPMAVVTLSAFAAIGLWAVGYNTADSHVYLTLALPLAAFWLGIGLRELTLRLGRNWSFLPWALMIIPLLQILLFGRSISLRGDRSSVEWAKSVLEAAPPGAILVSSSDPHTFTLWYVQEILGERPDILVVDRDLWWHEPCRKMILKALGIGENVRGIEELSSLTGRPIVEAR